MMIAIPIICIVLLCVGPSCYKVFKQRLKDKKPSLLLSDYMEMKITYCDICLMNVNQKMGKEPICYSGPDCVYRGKDITEKCSSGRRIPIKGIKQGKDLGTILFTDKNKGTKISKEDMDKILFGDEEENDFWENFGEDNTE